MTRLNGKTALITDASGSLGAAIARRFAREGADLMVHYNSDGAGAQELAAYAHTPGRRADIRAADFRDAATPEMLSKLLTIRSAGSAFSSTTRGVARLQPFGKLDDNAIDLIFDINVKAVLRAMNAAATHLRDGGRILNIGSSTSEFPAPGLSTAPRK